MPSETQAAAQNAAMYEALKEVGGDVSRQPGRSNVLVFDSGEWRDGAAGGPIRAPSVNRWVVRWTDERAWTPIRSRGLRPPRDLRGSPAKALSVITAIPSESKNGRGKRSAKDG
jgi:hypothetical protein